jgi:hypothetical protein
MAESNLPLDKTLELFREQDRQAALRWRASSLAAAANERRRQEAERSNIERTIEHFCGENRRA